MVVDCTKNLDILTFISCSLNGWCWFALCSHWIALRTTEEPRMKRTTFRRVSLSCLVVVLSGVVQLDAFLYQKQSQKEFQKSKSKSSLFLASSSNLNRFHLDLRNVLSPREDCSGYFLHHLERHSKPIILPYDVDGAEKSFKMLQHMVRIGCWSEESFQIVMQAFLQRGRVRWKVGPSEYTCAADQLEHLVSELESTKGTTATTSTLLLLLQAYATCATPRGERNYAMRAQDVLQRMSHRTTESLPLLIQAWAWQQANKEPGTCAQRAQELVLELEQLTTDPTILKPAYDLVLEAWSKSKDAHEQANAIFQKRLKLGQVSMACYTNIILAWSKAPGGALRANDLLADMLDLFQKKKFAPDEEPELIAFNSVITAWGKAKQPSQGESLLHIMEETRLKCSTLIPNVLTYNAVIHAYFQSANSQVALERALALVRYMEDNVEEQPAIQPDNYTYSTLMKVSCNKS